ncbi:hypothetical protein V6N12_044737 [Hibiscus sabdariffa]|uniref:EF-hand domain-containing protein n=1 Tax=Hibiscus sabdariffa TaxID=183260 RepID=A0ABR2BCN5_9ROSI
MDPAELRRMFQMFDKNGDGKITNKELSESLENLGIFIPSTELIQMVEKIDVNGDGYVDIDEFGALYQTIMHERDEEEDMMEAFNVFDQNRDGFITVEELRSVLSSLGLKQGRTIEDCKRMIQKVDVDGDGARHLQLHGIIGINAPELAFEDGIGLSFGCCNRFDYEMSPWEVCMPVSVTLIFLRLSPSPLLVLSPLRLNPKKVRLLIAPENSTTSLASLPFNFNPFRSGFLLLALKREGLDLQEEEKRS